MIILYADFKQREKNCVTYLVIHKSPQGNLDYELLVLYTTFAMQSFPGCKTQTLMGSHEILEAYFESHIMLVPQISTKYIILRELCLASQQQDTFGMTYICDIKIVLGLHDNLGR